MPFNERISYSIGEFPRVFEYLYAYGDEETKRQTKLLAYKYLKKARMFARPSLEPLLSNEISSELKEVIQTKMNFLDTIVDVEKKKDEERSFQENYLNDYARNFGMASLAYIKPLLIVPKEFIKYKENSETQYRITDYPTILLADRALHAIKELSINVKLSAKDKQSILDLLIAANLQNSDTYHWRYYADILKNLYPEKKFSDFKYLFPDEDKYYGYTKFEEYWNRQRQTSSDLDQYLDYLKQIGFETDNISLYDRFNFSAFEDASKQTALVYVLSLLNVSVFYDCETGVWPNPYDELILQYLRACRNDLPEFFPIYEYEKSNDDYKTKYAAVLTNGKTGYKVNPKDYGDWYDPSAIEALLNQALRDSGIQKRFIQIPTGDQSVLSIYCEPGQLKLFADKFGLKISDEQDDEW